jgi:predicted adenine nucleotide alpha hydrolase (AANH) superfamily ATPase
MNILVHICCAPCSIFPIEDLKRQGHKIAGFFYNPNIQPYSEYLKRKAEAEKCSKKAGINVIYGDYDIEKYFEYIIYNEDGIKNRCPICWWLRMQQAAKFAKENGFDAFTTTLLGSPYQNHDILKKICEDISEKAGLDFYYQDFRPGFKDAQKKARAEGMYLQNYCGCLFSEKDRMEKRVKG